MDFCLLFDNFQPLALAHREMTSVKFIRFSLWQKLNDDVIQVLLHAALAAHLHGRSLENCAAWENSLFEKLKLRVEGWLLFLCVLVSVWNSSVTHLQIYSHDWYEYDNIERCFESVAELSRFYYLIMENKLILKVWRWKFGVFLMDLRIFHWNFRFLY